MVCYSHAHPGQKQRSLISILSPYDFTQVRRTCQAIRAPCPEQGKHTYSMGQQPRHLEAIQSIDVALSGKNATKGEHCRLAMSIIHRQPGIHRNYGTERKEKNNAGPCLTTTHLLPRDSARNRARPSHLILLPIGYRRPRGGKNSRSRRTESFHLVRL